MSKKINKFKFKQSLTSLAISVGFLAGAAIAATPAKASSFFGTLQDKNSSTSFELDTTKGFFNWVVDGKNHLAQDYYFYRIGESGPEKSISDLIIDANNTYIADTDSDPGYDVLYAVFKDPNSTFKLEIKWSLLGSPTGTGESNFSKQINIINTSNQALQNFHLFSFTNLNLANNGSDDKAAFSSLKDFYQEDATTVADGTQNSRPSTTRYEVGKTSDILAKLTDAKADNLSNNVPFGIEVGPFDVATAVQWTYNSIGVGKSATIGQNIIITAKESGGENPSQVPEPGTMLALFAAGSLGFGLKFKKQQAAK